MSDKNLRFLLFGEDRTAGKTFSKAAEDANSATSRIGATFSKMGGLVGGEVGELVGKVGEGFSQMGEHGAKVGAKMMAIGGVIGGIGVAAQQFASKDQAAHQQLQAAIDATGKGYDGLDQQIENAIHTQEKYGHQASDTQDALRIMTEAMQDPTKAMANMTLVENLAAAKHLSLADAAAMVAKAHGGSTRIFREFGITVGKNKDGTKDFDGALVNLAGRLTGQASAASDTFAGKVAGVRARVEDTGAAIADKLGPALTTAGPLIMGVGAIMESKLLPTLAKSVGAWAESGGAAVVSAAKSVAASGVVIGGWIASAATATASGIAMAAAWVIGLGPIAWIIAAVVAVGAAFVVLYNKVGWFHDGVNAAWNGIKVGFEAVKNWLIDAWNGTVSFLGGIPNKIGSAFAAVTGFITAPFRLAFNTVSSLWNSTIGSLNVNLPSFLGGAHISFPKLPMLASGTNYFGGGLALVGENGPELAHFPAGTKVTPSGQTAAALSKGAMNGGPLLHIENFNALGQSPAQIASEFAFQIRTA